MDLFEDAQHPLEGGAATLQLGPTRGVGTACAGPGSGCRRSRRSALLRFPDRVIPADNDVVVECHDTAVPAARLDGAQAAFLVGRLVAANHDVVVERGDAAVLAALLDGTRRPLLMHGRIVGGAPRKGRQGKHGNDDRNHLPLVHDPPADDTFRNPCAASSRDRAPAAGCVVRAINGLSPGG